MPVEQIPLLQIVQDAVRPPFDATHDLTTQMRVFRMEHTVFRGEMPEMTQQDIATGQETLNTWLKDPQNKQSCSDLIHQAVAAVQIDEASVLSESHDLLHLSESIQCLLDDAQRGIAIDDATIFMAAVNVLVHDLGRHTEKELSAEQLDLSTPVHHDDFSFRATHVILSSICDELDWPDDIKRTFSQLLYTNMKHLGETGRLSLFAVGYDTDRRQLSGSPDVVRDVLYYGGMQQKSLSPTAGIMRMPSGYTHYDSGGFFGQNNTMARYVYRDPTIRNSHRLDEIYDPLAIEAATIVLLGCGNSITLREHAFDVDDGRVSTPAEGYTQEGKPWWPKKPLPSDGILPAAKIEAQRISTIITDRELPVDDLRELVGTFLDGYATIVIPEHRILVQDAISRLSNQEQLAWVRIMYYAHTQNQIRYQRRFVEWQKQDRQGTFLAVMTKPFLDVILNKNPQHALLDKQLSRLFPSSAIQ